MGEEGNGEEGRGGGEEKGGECGIEVLLRRGDRGGKEVGGGTEEVARLRGRGEEMRREEE